jgi:hypothetical protein
VASAAGKGKRVLAAALVALATWGGLELVAFAGLSIAEGGLVAPGRFERQRRQLLAGGAGGAERGPEGGEALLALAAGGAGREALHPYLGYVFDPALNVTEDRVAEGRLLISELGFFVPPAGREAAPPPAVPHAAAGDPLDVALFGGSVAFILSFEGDEALRAALAEVPAFAGRPVRFARFALGGYKQPQQLATFAWLLSLGRSFDLVINLDGFNEVVLPWVENLPQGTHPLYPRSWAGRVAGLPDPGRLERAGELAFLRGRREDRARLFSRPLVRHSYVWNLLWRLQDGALRGRVGEAEAALLRRPPAAPRGYAATGPEWRAGSEAATFRELAAAWARGSLQMHRLAAGNGIRYYHFLQPNQYVPGGKRLSAEERRRAFDPGHPYRHAVEAGYPELAAAGAGLAREGVRFTDLTGIFRGVEESVWLDTCCHLNRRGTELLARAIGDAVAADFEAGPGAAPP